MGKKTVLVIDDMRTFSLPAADIEYARTYAEGIRALQNNEYDFLALDHDLGEEKTGYDIAKWLLHHPDRAPKGLECVSANPVGRANIEATFKKIEEMRDDVRNL